MAEKTKSLELKLSLDLDRANPHPTQRFSARADVYTRHRPSYPPSLIDELDKTCRGLNEKPIADIGSGTGIFSRLLMERGARVWGVEPNTDMRLSAQADLGYSPGFTGVDGRAEATSLAPASVDVITCAQAFHWFDPVQTRAEFTRILKPGGWVALVWNKGKKESPFVAAYNEFREQFSGTLYQDIKKLRANAENSLGRFFRSGYRTQTFSNHQIVDKEGLIGRFFSESHSPTNQDRAACDLARRELGALFDRHQSDGIVRIEYVTYLFIGVLGG